MTKSETQTRSELIDKQLASAGWNVKDPKQVVEEFDISTSEFFIIAEPNAPYRGHQFSDYVLLGKNGRPLAVIEAKKPVKTQPLVVSRPNNIAATFKNSLAANCRSAFTPTAWKRFLGIWTTIQPVEWLVCRTCWWGGVGRKGCRTTEYAWKVSAKALAERN